MKTLGTFVANKQFQQIYPGTNIENFKSKLSFLEEYNCDWIENCRCQLFLKVSRNVGMAWTVGIFEWSKSYIYTRVDCFWGT